MAHVRQTKIQKYLDSRDLARITRGTPGNDVSSAKVCTISSKFPDVSVSSPSSAPFGDDPAMGCSSLAASASFDGGELSDDRPFIAANERQV
jgi:hypothetical protein